MGIGELDSLRRQAVDVGSFDFGGSVTTQVSVTEVIGKDENEVGLGALPHQRQKGWRRDRKGIDREGVVT